MRFTTWIGVLILIVSYPKLGEEEISCRRSNGSCQFSVGCRSQKKRLGWDVSVRVKMDVGRGKSVV
jgi:hypothetical protein